MDSPRSHSDRYRVLRLLGEGSAGRVWLVEDSRRSGARIALKELTESDPERVKSLRLEFSTLTQLVHPNLVRVHDLDQASDTGPPHITLEYVDGVDFVTAVDREGPSLLCDLTAEALRALAFLHDFGVVHRDVKPANMMVRRRPRLGCRLVVLDFGLTLRGGGETGGATTAGTLPYLAPELFEGRGASPCSDLYALGALLFQAVHGRTPFELKGRDVTSFIAAVRDGRRTRPRAPDTYPGGLSDWIDELLSPDPERRPSRAVEALARFNAACGTDYSSETPAGRAARLASGAPPGREREIDLLWQHLTEADHPRVILVCGGAGSGKKRLLRWLAGEAVARGWSCLTPPPDPGRSADLGATLDLWRRRAGEGPTICLVEGIESAPQSMVGMLERVAREARAAPLKVVAALRPDEIRHPTVRELVAQAGTVPGLRRIDLGPLREAGIRGLAERVAGGPVAASKVRWLHGVSEGHPHVAEALLVGGAWERGGRRPKVPAADRSLSVRLEQLSAPALEWLRALCVLGEPSPTTSVATLAGLDVDAAREAEAEIAAMGLARRHDDVWLPDSRLLAEHVLDQTDETARRTLFLRAARRLSENGPARPARLAVLWSGAGRDDLAVEMATKAADDAEGRGDPVGAADQLTFALRRLPRRDPRRLDLRLRQARALRDANLGLPAVRAFGAALALTRDAKTRAEILAAQASTLVLSGRLDRGRAAADEALTLARSLRLPRVEAQARRAIGIELARRGDGERAVRFLEDAVRIFGEVGDRLAQARALQALALFEINRGLPRAESHFRSARELFEGEGRSDQGLVNWVGLAAVQQRCGHYEEARELLEETRRRAAEHGNLLMDGVATFTLVRTLFFEGRLAEVVALSRACEEQAQFLGDRRLICGARSVRAQALARCGRSGEAVELLERTLRGSLERVDPMVLLYTRTALAEARLLAGVEGSPTSELPPVLLSELRELRDPDTLPWGLVLEIERRADRGDDAPEALFEELEALTALGGSWDQPHYRLRAGQARARWLLRRGDAETAHTLAAEVGAEARRFGLVELAARAAASCAEALQRLDRAAESSRVLQQGQELLHRAAQCITDSDLRAGFLERPELIRLRQPVGLRATAMNRRLVALYDMIRALNSESDPEALLDVTLDMALEVVNAQRGLILQRAGRGEFVVRVARNLEKETIRDAEKFSRSVVMRAGAGKAVLAVNTDQDARLRELESVSMYGIRSVLCVPLRSRGRITGAVYVDSRGEGTVFGQEDLEFLAAFADHAALSLQNAEIRRQLENENRRLQVAAESRVRFGNLIGRSPVMQQVFELIDKVSASNLPVLIQGESGTGKELVARAVHFNGPRRKRSFISENCAAIPDSLLQSELFGHARGAFTGADRDRQGLFEQADGGTLFLDEVGDMSPSMQAQLLRVLQEGEVRRVGGDRPIKVDVRVIAATHRMLADEAAAGRFREDLMYRLQVLVLHLPPLRERTGDISLLTDAFLERMAKERQRPKPLLHPEVLDLLERHRWCA
jgi:Nif-specific regulatory protein